MYKIEYLKSFIKKFNGLSYSSQCDYIKNKLLSFDLYEIQFIMFFKKLHVLINDLPTHFKKIGKDNKRYIYNFVGVLSDNDEYFCATSGSIDIKYKKLSYNIYSVKIPIKNSELYLHTYVELN